MNRQDFNLALQKLFPDDFSQLPLRKFYNFANDLVVSVRPMRFSGDGVWLSLAIKHPNLDQYSRYIKMPDEETAHATGVQLKMLLAQTARS